MKLFKEPGTYMALFGLAFTVWFYMMLFHYSHQYKATKNNITYIIYSDNPYEKGDRILFHDSDLGYIEGHTSAKVDTAVITKVLR